MNLIDLIKYENESTGLDFKSVQYPKAKHADLLKDILAMANAQISGERFIIIGVNYLSNGSRDILGIKENFVDSAIYQQLTNENIEPELKIQYDPFEFDGKIIGILKISDCSNQPYMMKKDFGDALKKGDCFIRKGSHQTRFSRADLDTIVEKKVSATSFSGEIDCNFSESERKIFEIVLKRRMDFPSYQSITKIEMIEKEEEDLYYLFEEVAARISFTLLNRGDRYIEDSTLELIIPKIKGVFVFSEIIPKPQLSYFIPTVNPNTFDNIHYPDVISDDDNWIITSKVGDLKHNISTITPEIPLRVLFSLDLAGSEINMRIKLHAKNLREPRKYELKVKIL